MLNTASKITSLVLLTFLVMSCQKNETDLLQEAQSCLNDSPSSEARNCVSKISSINTPASYKLRCAAIYIHEGFGAASSLISGLNDLNGSSGGSGCTGSCSPTLVVMNTFNFAQGDNADPLNRERNIATSEEAVSTCAMTDSKAYIQVSSLFKMGTLSKMKAFQLGVAPGQQPTLPELQAAMLTLPPAEIGELVMTTYNLACADNVSTSESAEYCTELSASISSYGADYDKIGECLLNKINDENFVCPP